MNHFPTELGQPVPPVEVGLPAASSAVPALGVELDGDPQIGVCEVDAGSQSPAVADLVLWDRFRKSGPAEQATQPDLRGPLAPVRPRGKECRGGVTTTSGWPPPPGPCATRSRTRPRPDPRAVPAGPSASGSRHRARRP